MEQDIKPGFIYINKRFFHLNSGEEFFPGTLLFIVLDNAPAPTGGELISCNCLVKNRIEKLIFHPESVKELKK